MSMTLRWIGIATSLLVLSMGCVEDSKNIQPASTAMTSSSGGAGKLTVSWNHLMVESYDLSIGTQPGGDESGKIISNVANPFQITDLPIGATYYFVLSAKNNNRTTLQTQEIAHTIQGTDDRVKISFPGKTNGITIAWNPTEGATSYNIYWRNSPGVSRRNGIKISNVKTPHKLTGLIPGIPYYFVVTAVGENGAESSVSEEISYTIKK